MPFQFVSPVTRWKQRRRRPAKAEAPITPEVKQRQRQHKSTPETCSPESITMLDLEESKTTPEIKQRRQHKSTSETCSPELITMLELEESNTVDSSDSSTDSKLGAIVALRNVIVKQRKQMNDYKSRERSHKQNMHRLSMTIQAKEMESIIISDRKRVVFFGPSFERSDDLSGLTSLDDSSTVSEDIRQAVSSIHEQASQVETAMALDELQSIKSEQKHLKQVLEKTKSGMLALQGELQAFQQQVSTLELQKELAQAEATKYKEDLQACVQHMVENYGVAKNEDPQNSLDHRRTPRRLFPILSQLSSRVVENYGVAKNEEPQNSLDHRRTPRRLIPILSPISTLSRSPEQKVLQLGTNVEDEIDYTIPSKKLLCLACKFHQQHKGDDYTETLIKASQQAPHVVTPYPQKDEGSNAIEMRQLRSCAAEHYEGEISRLKAQMEQFGRNQAQREKNLVYQLNQMDPANRDVTQQYQKQLRSKDSQIAQLRKEISIINHRRM